MGDIVLKYRGAEYRLPESRLFEVGAQIEDVAPLFEVVGWQSNPHMHKVAACLAIMLRASGAKVENRDVYRELVASVKSQDGYLALALFGIVAALMDGAPESDGTPGEALPAL